MDDPVLPLSQRDDGPHGRNRPIGITECDKAKLGCRVDDEILRHTTHMYHTQTRPLHPLDNEISISNGMHRVLADGHETQLGPQELSVEGIRVAGKCSGTEGENGDPGVDLAETSQVGKKRLNVGEEEV